MKKYLFMLATAFLCSWTAQAQTEQGAMAAGGGLTMGFGDSYTNFGIGVKYQYNVIDRLRLEPSVNYYFKKDYMDMWDLGVNAQWLCPIYEGIYAYPLAGIGVTGAKTHVGDALGDELGDLIGGPLGDEVKDALGDADSKVTNFFFNLGAGIECMVTSNVSINLEYKYRFCSDLNRSLLTLGAAYHF